MKHFAPPKMFGLATPLAMLPQVWKIHY